MEQEKDLFVGRGGDEDVVCAESWRMAVEKLGLQYSILGGLWGLFHFGVKGILF
jgi:hypothetical protein